jgi:Cu2+-exporting ATPase
VHAGGVLVRQPILSGMRRELALLRPGMDTLAGSSILLAYGASVVETLRGGRRCGSTRRRCSCCSCCWRACSSASRAIAPASAWTAGARAAATGLAPARGALEQVPALELQAGDEVRVRADETCPPTANCWTSRRVRRGAAQRRVGAGAQARGDACSPAAAPAWRRAPARDRGRRRHAPGAAAGAGAGRAGTAAGAGARRRPRRARFVLAMFARRDRHFWWWLPQGAGVAFPIALAVLVAACPCALALAVPASLSAAADAMARARRAGARRRRDRRPGEGGHRAVRQDRHAHRRRAAAARAAGFAPARTCWRWRRAGTRQPASARARLRCGAGRGRTSASCIPGRASKAARGARLRLGRADFAAGRVDDDALWLRPRWPRRWRASKSSTRCARMPANGGAPAGAGLRVQVASGDAADAVARACASWHRGLGIAAAAAGQARAAARLQAGGHRVLAVGDGLNDAPLLAGADVAAAIGSGSALAQRSADLLLTGERLAPLADALRWRGARAGSCTRTWPGPRLQPGRDRARRQRLDRARLGGARHGRLLARRHPQCLARRRRDRSAA